MKKVKYGITVAAFVVCMAACSGSRNSGSTGTTSDSTMQTPSQSPSSTPATDTSGMPATTRDSTQQK